MQGRERCKSVPYHRFPHEHSGRILPSVQTQSQMLAKTC